MGIMTSVLLNSVEKWGSWGWGEAPKRGTNANPAIARKMMTPAVLRMECMGAPRGVTRMFSIRKRSREYHIGKCGRFRDRIGRAEKTLLVAGGCRSQRNHNSRRVIL